jgi:hypothetical protein
VAGEIGPETGSGEEDQVLTVEGEVSGELWLISHYLCIGDSTGNYCPGLNRTATGTVVHPSTAACDPSFLGVDVEVGGIIYRCEDTGSAVIGPIIDIWCFSFECWDEACTQPCPSPCEVERGGRCYSEVRVVG